MQQNTKKKRYKYDGVVIQLTLERGAGTASLF